MLLGYYPESSIETLEPYFDVSGYPETVRVLERQEVAIIDTEDPTADPGEVELLRRDGKRGLLTLPLVAKDQSIGLVELFATTPVQLTDQRLQLARTMANEAAMALENARLYEDARNLADRDRSPASITTASCTNASRGGRPGPARAAAADMLMLDLDDFKLVADTFGHLFVDRVLTWTAELIRSTLRGSDIPARYGGDEFAITLAEDDHDQAPGRPSDPRGVPREGVRR